MTDESLEPQPDETWLTVAEVAAELRVNPATVRLWISKGSLPAQRVGQRKLFIARPDLERMLAESSEAVGSRHRGGGPPELPMPSVRQPARRLRQSLRPFPGMLIAGEDAQEANKKLQEAEAGWDAALSASDKAPPDPDFVHRLRMIAAAAQRQSDALITAQETSAFRWRPVRGSEGMILSHELRPGATRPGPEDLWTSFDRTVERLGVAMEGVSADLVQLEYLELADILGAIIKALADEQ